MISRTALILSLIGQLAQAGQLAIRNESHCVLVHQFQLKQKMSSFIFPQSITAFSESKATMELETSMFDSGLGASGIVEYRAECFDDQNAGVLIIYANAVDSHHGTDLEISKDWQPRKKDLVVVPSNPRIGRFKDGILRISLKNIKI